jgi:predicted nucleotidyltransferase
MFEKLLERIAQSLKNAGIPYMVIGGQAVLLYGEPRLTKDIDITLGVDLSRLEDVLSAVREMKIAPLVDPEAFTRATMVLPCSDPETGIRVDMIFSFSPFEQLAISRARIVKIGKADVCFASLEDLLVHKVIAGRARDLEDARVVLLKNPDADLAYIRRWLSEFSLLTNENYLGRLDSILQVLDSKTGKELK